MSRLHPLLPEERPGVQIAKLAGLLLLRKPHLPRRLLPNPSPVELPESLLMEHPMVPLEMELQLPRRAHLAVPLLQMEEAEVLPVVEIAPSLLERVVSPGRTDPHAPPLPPTNNQLSSLLDDDDANHAADVLD